MILFPQRKLLILTPPKTASETLHQALCREPWGGYHAVGIDQHSATGYSHHVCLLPDQALTWRIIGTVRHPLDRLVSLFHHHARGETFLGRAAWAFWFFARMACDPNEPALPAWYKRSVSDWYQGLKLDGVLRVEHLQDDLANEGFDLRLPRVNTSFRRPWREYYDEATLVLARAWAKADSEAYGYQLDDAATAPHPPEKNP